MRRPPLLRGVVLAAVITTTNAGARDAWQASLQSSKRDRPPPRSPIWDKSFRCVINNQNASTNAYAVVLGPISEERKYSKWVYPILALKAALKKRGSRADVLALLALEEDKERHRMLPGEEAMLRKAGVRYRYVTPAFRSMASSSGSMRWCSLSSSKARSARTSARLPLFFSAAFNAKIG